MCAGDIFNKKRRIMLYIQYIDGLGIDGLGIDGYSPLDGRCSLRTAIVEANNPNRNFEGYKVFEIRRGSLLHYTILHRGEIL